MSSDVRERIWRAIRASQPGWTMGDLMRIAGVELDQAQSYCAWLESAGYVRPHGQGRYRATQAARSTLAAPSPDGQERITLDLVLDTATNELRLLRESAPGAWRRVRQALVQPGSLRNIESNTTRDRVWTAIRQQRRCTWSDIVQTTGCAKGAVVDYLRLLRLAGYLVEVGRDGSTPILDLAHDPGPQRPAISETIRRSRRKS